MKIYINNFNLEILNDIIKLFKSNFNSYEKYIHLITNEGLYNIEDKNMYLLDAQDKNIVKYDNFYKNFDLIVDYSYFKKNIVTSIHGNIHLSIETQKHIYKLNDNSQLNLIIEYYLKNKKITASDIYFEIDKDVEIADKFIKNEIIEFLSLLT